MVEEEEVSQIIMYPLGDPSCFTLKCCVKCLPCSYKIAGTMFTSNYSITSNYDELEEVVFNFIVTLVPRPLWGKEPGAGVML